MAYPVDTLGLAMHAVVHAADIQDRDGGILVLASMFGLYPFLEKLFADGGYQGPQFRNALAKVSAAALGRNRQTIRQRQRLRGPAKTLGRGADVCLAQPLPTTGQGFREPEP